MNERYIPVANEHYQFFYKVYVQLFYTNKER